jgi:hypothetical protein
MFNCIVISIPTTVANIAKVLVPPLGRLLRVCFICLSVASARSEVVYSDSFARSGELEGSSPETKPDLVAWSAHSSFYCDSDAEGGSLLGGEPYMDGFHATASLPVSLESGRIYTFSATIFPEYCKSEENKSGWSPSGIGFRGASGELNLSVRGEWGAAWSLVTQAGEEKYQIETLHERGWKKIRIVIDTRQGEWTANFFLDDKNLGAISLPPTFQPTEIFLFATDATAAYSDIALRRDESQP